MKVIPHANLFLKKDISKLIEIDQSDINYLLDNKICVINEPFAYDKLLEISVANSLHHLNINTEFIQNNMEHFCKLYKEFRDTRLNNPDEDIYFFIHFYYLLDGVAEIYTYFVNFNKTKKKKMIDIAGGIILIPITKIIKYIEKNSE